jgi:hypothetical protein
MRGTPCGSMARHADFQATVQCRRACVSSASRRFRVSPRPLLRFPPTVVGLLGSRVGLANRLFPTNPQKYGYFRLTIGQAQCFTDGIKPRLVSNTEADAAERRLGRFLHGQGNSCRCLSFLRGTNLADQFEHGPLDRRPQRRPSSHDSREIREITARITASQRIARRKSWSPVPQRRARVHRAGDGRKACGPGGLF